MRSHVTPHRFPFQRDTPYYLRHRSWHLVDLGCGLDSSLADRGVVGGQHRRVQFRPELPGEQLVALLADLEGLEEWRQEGGGGGVDRSISGKASFSLCPFVTLNLGHSSAVAAAATAATAAEPVKVRNGDIKTRA